MLVKYDTVAREEEFFIKSSTRKPHPVLQKLKKIFGKEKNIWIRILFGTLKLALIVYFVIFFIFPLIYKFSYSLQRNVLFLNFVNWPKNPDYNNPHKYGLDGARNLYVTTNEGIKLGVWQVLPESLANATSETQDDEFYSEALRNSENVIIYLHGNSGHRLAPHRLELYHVLRKFFFVVAFDYRSYGDSSDVDPSEDGLVNDSRFMYNWVKNKTEGHIYVWGHSLGTGVSTHMLHLLNDDGISPAGLILESPFNNIRDEISEHPFARPFKHLPWFSYTVVDPMTENKLVFASDKHIKKIDCPIMILHAKDDLVVPFKLGQKLFKEANDTRQDSQGSVSFVKFEANFNYGHKYICRAPELLNILPEFIESSHKENSEKHLEH